MLTGLEKLINRNINFKRKSVSSWLGLAEVWLQRSHRNVDLLWKCIIDERRHCSRKKSLMHRYASFYPRECQEQLSMDLITSLCFYPFLWICLSLTHKHDCTSKLLKSLPNSNPYLHQLNLNPILTLILKPKLNPLTHKHPKCPHFLKMSLLSKSSIQIGPHWDRSTRTRKHISRCTWYVIPETTQSAELGGTIMSSFLLDLLSANRSNWMMIIIWAISSLKHFYKTSPSYCFSFSPVSFSLCSLSHFSSSLFSSFPSILAYSVLPTWKRDPKPLLHLGF